MTELTLNVNLALDNKTIAVPYNATTTAEDICIYVCKQLSIGTLARHLTALRVVGKQVFLMPSATFNEKNINVDFRIRFKVASISKLRKLDPRAYNYYFAQARNDVLDNKIPDIVYEKYRRELIGLGIADMYRVMLEKDIPRETIENEYKKYIPKEVLKKHPFFIKKPIHDTLGKLQKSGHDASYVKAEYIRQLEIIAPEYLYESYKALIDKDGVVCSVMIKVFPYHPTEPGIKYCLESKRDWQQICTIDELGFVSIRDDGTTELSRKNGIPFYLKFNSISVMLSFISLLDGYYRLTCKWTFNICKDVATPSLLKLYAMKCHGPVGGEFSYAKLEEKRGNKPGCFILRESELKYNNFYIDVCIKDSLKPKTFKLELIGDEFIFKDDLNKYKTIHQLVAAYDDPNAEVYLQECLPPSEYDKSPLLLCQNENLAGDALTNSSDLHVLLPSAPLCINWKDLQVYKDRKCLKWNKNRKKVKHAGVYIKEDKHDKFRFPEGSLSEAKKFCRNPDGDIGGPWCYVENEDTNEIEREYCDVAFCDSMECLVFTKNDATYMHYTDFNASLSNVSFALKLWDPDSYIQASARLVLSLLALPVTGKDMEDLGVGIEIFISNNQSALTFGNKDAVEYENTHGILKSTEYTKFSLSWHAGFITLSLEGQLKPIFLAEYRTKKNLLGYKKNQFKFYAAQGTNVLWSFPFCMDDFECDVHTTTGDKFQQFWPLRESSVGHDLYIHVRAFHSASVLIIPVPTKTFPNVHIILSGSNGFTRIIVNEFENGPVVVLKELQLVNLLDYWEWREFSVSLFANTMQIYMKKAVGMQLLSELNHEVFRKMRWFTVSSQNTVAHWSFFCVPPMFSNPPPALLPECALDREEADYKGTQSVTSEGLPCLPWSGKKLIQENVDEWFTNESTVQVWNFCRDPLGQKQGTYCFALSMKPQKEVEKRYCMLRKCKSEQCRMAGTGNDYIGPLNSTRSNRTCDSWEVSNASLHKKHWNDTLFPDMYLVDAKNYCRNPSRDISGTWCYTTDKRVLQDLCSVKDCDKPEECTIIISSKNKGQKKEGLRGLTMVYRSMWKITKGKKIEVAMKILKQESADRFVKDFLTLAGQWAFLKSNAIVRLYGITLTSNISLVMEYFRLGPLDNYLQEKRGILKPVDLIEAASNLAAALWHLKENDIVHGNIRCRKLMVCLHDENSFNVKLTDPGIRLSYSSNEVHWLPVECYANLDFAKRSSAADVWAFATTLWEIFMFGEDIKPNDHVQTMRWYASGKRLHQPSSCSNEIYSVMKECWEADPHRRKHPQAIMRDINKILYQLYNSRRTHSYAKLFNKAGLQSKTGTTSSGSLYSSNTESTTVGQYSDDLIAASEVCSQVSDDSSFSGHQSQNWLMNSQDLDNYEDTISGDFMNLFTNFDFSTATTSLDSLNSMQSIFELDDDCNVVLQGRIGQGFYGEVYKGTLEYLGDEEIEPRKVAVKKLKSSALSSCLQDFEREINIMKTLKHPNIVEILGVLREPEISLVMEFVQHGSLQSYLKINREFLQIKQLLKYALDIANGMDYLGKKNIVHRDLAARNILVVDENHVKISDFGLAQVMGTNDYYILKTNRDLPIKWYAPESLRDGKFSVRSDVWSFGVTLCEMFNFGEEPHFVNINNDVEGQEQQILLNALEQGVRLPAPQACPQAVYIYIMRPCWHADPHDRPFFSKLVESIEQLLLSAL